MDVLCCSGGVPSAAARRWGHRRFSAFNPLPACLIVMLFEGALLTPSPACALEKTPVASPQLTYVKVLKGSSPEYEKVVVNSGGSGEYDAHKLTEPPNPRHFKLSDATTQRLFALADELNDFRDVSLESRKRVADLGSKTLRYEDGGRIYQCQFNYSTNRAAQQLTDLFESIGMVERHIAALDYAMKYDHLGLPRELTLIQIDLDNKSLVDPQLMVSVLEDIAHDPRFLHLAQVRAEALIRQIQSNSPE